MMEFEDIFSWNEISFTKKDHIIVRGFDSSKVIKGKKLIRKLIPNILSHYRSQVFFTRENLARID